MVSLCLPCVVSAAIKPQSVAYFTKLSTTVNNTSAAHYTGFRQIVQTTVPNKKPTVKHTLPRVNPGTDYGLHTKIILRYNTLRELLYLGKCTLRLGKARAVRLDGNKLDLFLLGRRRKNPIIITISNNPRSNVKRAHPSVIRNMITSNENAKTH